MSPLDIALPPDAHAVPDADPATYRDLLQQAAGSGRSPVWFGPSARPRAEPGRVASTRIDEHDPAAVLAGWWPGPCRSGCGCLEPFPDGFPGLVRRDRPVPPTAVLRNAADLAAGLRGASLALVDVARPADVPAAIGWTGTRNRPYQELAALSAVLRSWEDRFGAVLVWLSGTRLVLSVTAPPLSIAESEQVAAEHLAFCPDQADPQDGRDPFTPRTYAATIRGVRSWRFWWD